VKNNKKELVKLSASKLKVLKECSFKFWCQYFLKLPRESNDGARRGTVSHLLLQVLVNKRHKRYFDLIVKSNKKPSQIPAIKRLILKTARKEGLSDMSKKGEDNFGMIDEMILVGLSKDFFNKGCSSLVSEGEFQYISKNKKFCLVGFIDKQGIRPDGSFKITDYKTSQQMFSKDELENNVQAMSYALATRRLKNAKSSVEFLFLRFPEEKSQVCSFSDESLDGFEDYLEHIAEYISDFNWKKAESELAKDKGFTKGFSGLTMCSRCEYPGQLKRNGEPMYYCPMKFGFWYFVLLDKNGEIIESSFENTFNAKNGEKVEKRKFKGCPGFKHLNQEWY
jgi:PD-(D/E)XK nuclease superfamily